MIFFYIILKSIIINNYLMKGNIVIKKMLLLVWLCVAYPSLANVTQIETKEECEDLISRGKKALNDQQFPLALELLTKAEILAEKKNWPDELFIIKINMGNIYSALTSNGDALDYYRQALDIAKQSKSEENVTKVLNNIGLVYSYEKDYPNAILYFKKAYQFKGDTRARIAVNISDIYNRLGDFSEAKRYLEAVKDIPTTVETTQMWEINYAESLFLEGKTDEALERLESLSNNVENSCKYCVAQLLTRIYVKLGRNDLAIHHAEYGIANEKNFLKRSDLYNQLFEIYSKQKEYETAIKYKDSVLISKDSIAARINRGLYETIKVKLKIQEYQNELETRKERQENERNFFIIVILFGLVLSFSI